MGKVGLGKKLRTLLIVWPKGFTIMRKKGLGRAVFTQLSVFPDCLLCYCKTGATIVNYNPLYAEDELAKQIEDIARLIIL